MTTLTESSTTSTKNRFSPSAAMGGRRVLLPYLGSVTVVAALVFIAVLFMGNVEGVEFAPSHFELREFSYWEIPILNLQVSPVDRVVVPLNIANQLMTGRQVLVQRPHGQAAHWDLVEVTRGGQTHAADAQLLVGYLCGPKPPKHSLPLTHYSPNRPDTFWYSWTSNHPAYAAKLWPRVQEIAKQKQYLLIPELFRLAADATAPDTKVSVAEFEQTLDQLLATLPQSP